MPLKHKTKKVLKKIANFSDEVTIDSKNLSTNYVEDLWRYRDLLYFLSWRDVIAKYKQTLMGVTWALLKPFITMVVMTFVFGKLAKMDSGGVPYPILVFAASLPWQLFSTAFTQCAARITGSGELMQQVYFPRILLPLSSLCVAIVDFFISFLLLLAMMAWYGYPLTWKILFLPPILLVALAVAFGVGIFLGSLNTRFRDIAYIMPLITQFGLYVSPVGFSTDVIPEHYQLLYALNPLVAVIEGCRWAILGTDFNVNPIGMIGSLIITALLLIYGIKYFKKAERWFVDVL